MVRGFKNHKLELDPLTLSFFHNLTSEGIEYTKLTNAMILAKARILNKYQILSMCTFYIYFIHFQTKSFGSQLPKLMRYDN